MITDERVRHASGQSSKVPSTFTKKPRERRLSSSSEMSEQLLISCRWFAEALGLMGPEGLALLSDKISVQTFEEGDVLIEQGSEEEQLMLVLTGSVRLIQEPVFDEEPQEEEDNTVSRLYPRELVGGLQLLTNEPSFYTVRACNKTAVAIIGKKDFNTLLEARPQIYLPVAHSVLRRLSPFLRGVDFALDWVLVDSGQAVYRAGDAADSMFVVLSGRLRSVEKKTVVEEFGRGDVLGMMEVLQKKPRSTTVLAVRFSQLARVPEGLLNFIKLQYPQVGFRLVQLLGQYYSSINRRAPFIPGTISAMDAAPGDPMSHIKNLHTIAVVPSSSDVPLIPFTCELYHALSANLRVLSTYFIIIWLYITICGILLIIINCFRCLRQADAILVVAMGNKNPQKHTLSVKFMIKMNDLLSTNQDGVRTNKELILLWPDGTSAPSGTHEWLKNTYFSGHHHIRAHKRMFQWTRKGRRSPRDSLSPVCERDIIDYYEKNIFWSVDYRSDFARLARILTGNAIGLVLGGGGARGAAHIGVLRAIREQGIPIDIVGGTSIGSMIGGLYAETPDERVEERAKSWFSVSQNFVTNFTFLKFTYNSTSEMRVHRSGPLWAYCRASMSLAGYLPPLCDPQDGHLLLDGGYVNNLPADVMRSMGAKCVIAVDVGSVEETNLFNYGDSLSGLWVLTKRLNPWAEPVRILNMEEIQSRLAYVSCVRQLEIVKKAPYCHYLRPAIDPFKTLDFGKFNAIMATVLFGDIREGRLNRQASRTSKRSGMERTTSFTDLAAAMSKIPAIRPILRHSFSAVEPGEDMFDDLMFLDHSDADNEMSHSDFNDASEAEEESHRGTTPRPI
uniref:Swiss cheese n=1 Tax=Heterorhabditis bacteriophora TaxID=37862 RepID=A0A1I7XT43_HETBA